MGVFRDTDSIGEPGGWMDCERMGRGHLSIYIYKPNVSYRPYLVGVVCRCSVGLVRNNRGHADLDVGKGTQVHTARNRPSRAAADRPRRGTSEARVKHRVSFWCAI